MSTKTTYRASIEVPVYFAWRCQKSNEINFNYASLQHVELDSTTSFSKDEKEAARKRAINKVEGSWKDQVLDILEHPNQHGSHLISSLTTSFGITCSKCNKNCLWYIKGRGAYLVQMFVALPIAVLFLILAIGNAEEISLWVFFAVAAAFFAQPLIKEGIILNKIKKLPDKYMPVFGTKNEELLDYAEKKGIEFPTPEEAVSIVSSR